MSYGIDSDNWCTLNFLFWNLGRRTPVQELADLAAGMNANFVALAEYSGTHAEIAHSLSSHGIQLFEAPQIGCPMIRVFTSFASKFLHPKRETHRYTIQELRLPDRAPVLVAMVHLQSKLHANDDDQLLHAQIFLHDLEATEAEVGHRNTVVFGDFNMNPFDKGMTSVGALNSLPCNRTASNLSRTFNGKEYQFFYNPSWNLLGDVDDSPGTYFHSSPKSLSLYWNVLDQVLVRPGLSDRFDKNSLRVHRYAGIASLVSANGRPSTSDHLPISFTINLP